VSKRYDPRDCDPETGLTWEELAELLDAVDAGHLALAA